MQNIFKPADLNRFLLFALRNRFADQGHHSALIICCIGNQLPVTLVFRQSEIGHFLFRHINQPDTFIPDMTQIIGQLLPDIFSCNVVGINEAFNIFRLRILKGTDFHLYPRNRMRTSGSAILHTEAGFSAVEFRNQSVPFKQILICFQIFFIAYCLFQPCKRHIIGQSRNIQCLTPSDIIVQYSVLRQVMMSLCNKSFLLIGTDIFKFLCIPLLCRLFSGQIL